MVGSNFDAYYETPRIWFEKGNQPDEYGAFYTGGRFDGINGFAPQTGMNEMGLTFSRLASPTPEKELKVKPNKKQITNPTNYLKSILHKCKTIDEVKTFISQYDHSFFINDVFIYVEPSGRYLIVEPDTMSIGNDAKYVLANFCPSTTDLKSVKQERYIKGVAFRGNITDTSIAFCTALSDTMHVCRKKIGDGTLLTIIRDIDEGIIYLYFYHDFKHLLTFNLKDELKKGDHFYEVPTIFPPNAEFKKLLDYKIPQNNRAILSFMIFCGGLFLFSAAFFIIDYFIKRKSISYSSVKPLIIVTGLLLVFYMLILTANRNIFYFDAPYKDYKFSIFDVAAYIPYLMLLIIIPVLFTNVKIIRENKWQWFSKYLLTMNSVSYIILMLLFTYWGFYSIF